jgi:hypothetical protein
MFGVHVRYPADRCRSADWRPPLVSCPQCAVALSAKPHRLTGLSPGERRPRRPCSRPPRRRPQAGTPHHYQRRSPPAGQARRRLRAERATIVRRVALAGAALRSQPPPSQSLAVSRGDSRIRNHPAPAPLSLWAAASPTRDLVPSKFEDADPEVLNSDEALAGLWELENSVVAVHLVRDVGIGCWRTQSVARASP